MRNVLHASLLGFGLFLIWALLLPPANWIYDRLAIRAAFGWAGGSPPLVSVTSIKKPFTVTFSNGVVAEVGYLPATVSSAFHVVAFVVGGGFYLYKFRRQIRLFLNETSRPTVNKPGAA